TDQALAVRVLTGSADAVSVLVGPAGTGKTYTLDALRRVFESAGFEVVSERTLSRWRNFAHPVRRTLFVLRAAG
ncbi:MAG: AAA family ATPase, partial [Pyrinomonadaceae bacterium]